MAASCRRKNPTLSERLFDQGFRFDFFQAVRLLERDADDRAARDAQQPARLPVGADARPVREVVRFRAAPSLRFPAGSILNIKPAESDPDTGMELPAEMTVAFMGLTGPSGVLPQHYTSLLIERCHVANKDETLREFLDLFNHRSISLFFRAWEKYRFPFEYERVHGHGRSGQDDPFSVCLFMLVGLGTSGLRGRMQVDDEAILHYAGHVCHFPRSAVSLQRLLADYFQLPVEVRQFQGQWLMLSENDQSCLPSAKHPRGLNSELGANVVVGDRVWDVQSKFRIRLGPLTYRQFSQFTPIGDALVPMCQLVRLYAGPGFDFDIECILKAAEVPPCQLTSDGDPGPRLGWNTWLCSRKFDRDARDAVFKLAGI